MRWMERGWLYLRSQAAVMDEQPDPSCPARGNTHRSSKAWVFGLGQHSARVGRAAIRSRPANANLCWNLTGSVLGGTEWAENDLRGGIF